MEATLTGTAVMYTETVSMETLLIRITRTEIIHTEKAPTEGTSTEALTDRGQILMETASTVPMRRRTERNIRD